MVSAASINSIKKAIIKNVPPCICEKTIGRLSKTRLGPLFGSTPKLKRDGKIINPANTAIKVLTMPVINDVLSHCSFLCKCDDNVIITPNPSESAKNTCPKTSTKSLTVILLKSGVR